MLECKTMNLKLAINIFCTQSKQPVIGHDYRGSFVFKQVSNQLIRPAKQGNSGEIYSKTFLKVKAIFLMTANNLVSLIQNVENCTS